MKITKTIYLHLRVGPSEKLDNPQYAAYDFDFSYNEGYALVGTQEVEFDLIGVDVRGEAVAKAEKQITEVRAKAASDLRQLADYRDSLLAIEYTQDIF